MSNELTELELQALKKDANMVVYNDHKLLRSSYEKSVAGENKDLASVCLVRIAMALDRSRIPHHEKAHHWEVAALSAQSISKPCAPLFNNAAELLGRDLAHEKSARLYENTVNASIEENMKQSETLDMFRNCRRQYDLAGNSESASRMFILENNFKLLHSKGVRKASLYLYRLISSYGESPLRVAVCGLVVILSCAVIYYFLGVYSSGKEEVVHSLPTSLYYSVVTFTTLGYGDFSPMSSFTRLTSSCEAILGLLITSLFLVTVVRKYAR